MSALEVELLPSIKEAATRLAAADGLSLNDWIASAVAQKVSAIESDSDYFSRRASRRVPGALLQALQNASAAPPEPHDALPEGWVGLP